MNVARVARRCRGIPPGGNHRAAGARRSDAGRRGRRRNVGRARRQPAGQHLPAGLAHYGGPAFRLEPHDQRDFFLLSAHLIPRQPHAIAVADFRFAVMSGKLFGGEDVLLIGSRVAKTGLRFVEGVDRQGPFDLDRRLFLSVVKHQPPAKAAQRWLIGLSQHRVGPYADDLFRFSRLVVLVERPGTPRSHVPIALGGRR